jgi:isopentenyl-diphosphate Delta-isomerase
MNRKDEHIHLATKIPQSIVNDFDSVRFIHHSLSDLGVNDVDLSVNFDGIKLDVPFFINAMTGGSEWTKSINEQLARVAKKTGLAMATGSMSSAIKDHSKVDSFTIVRDLNPDGVVFANLQASATLDDVNQVIEWLNPNAVQLHMNVAQELLMPEGDREFYHWLKNIEHIMSQTTIPIIVKEVGFGLSNQIIHALHQAGVRNIDISGKGGTNFAAIENQRSDSAMSYMNDWGQSTVCSLLEAQRYVDSMNIIASGGVRHALDIVKSLALGAKAVGISGVILNTLIKKGEAETVTIIEELKEEIIKIMVLLNAKTVNQLKQTDLVFETNLISYAHQRRLKLEHLSNRRK